MKSISILISAAIYLSTTTNAATTHCPSPKYLGSFEHKQVAYIDTVPNLNTNGTDLLLSSFGGMPFSKGSIVRIEDINELLLSKNPFATPPASSKVDHATTWPNGIKYLHPDVYVAGATNPYRMISCGGFLVPTHGDGSCAVYDVHPTTGKITKIILARAGRGKFFHQATFYDVDGDGFKDLVTGKASKPILNGKKTGALYWYKNPGTSSNRRGHWKEHLMFEGPDVHFEILDLNNDGIPEILATQFFASPGFSVNWLKEGRTMEDGPSAWDHRFVVDDLGGLFNMTMVDVTGDGKQDVVFTNHADDAESAGVYALEIPTNFKTAEWKRHTLANDFPTLNDGPGQASPGGAIPFVLSKGQKYPHFAVSGDGNQKAWILCRTSAGWKRDVLIDTGNTVGGIAIADVTGDGQPEIFVPSYEKGEVHVYSYMNKF